MLFLAVLLLMFLSHHFLATIYWVFVVADRAKSLKTKAVVNESPTDKLIRELREENERLQKALQAAASNPSAIAALLDGSGAMGYPVENGVDVQGT